jgi:hypothetical protein
MAHTKKGSVNPRCKVGIKVRVKYGVIDPLFPDMPLGGWSGTVTEIIKDHGQVNCVFKLDDRTLESIHPICRRRCERDGLDFETMGLSKGLGARRPPMRIGCESADLEHAIIIWDQADAQKAFNKRQEARETTSEVLGRSRD